MKISIHDGKTRFRLWLPGWLAYGRLTVGVAALALKDRTGCQLTARQRRALRSALRDAREQLRGQPLIEVRQKDQHEAVRIIL